MVSPAFIPALSRPLTFGAPARPVSCRRPARMSLRKHAARLATIPASLALAAPTWASEGTGEGLGIDSALLFIPLISIPAIFLILYLQFDGSQDKSDFFGSYDERRN